MRPWKLNPLMPFTGNSPFLNGVWEEPQSEEICLESELKLCCYLFFTHAANINPASGRGSNKRHDSSKCAGRRLRMTTGELMTSEDRNVAIKFSPAIPHDCGGLKLSRLSQCSQDTTIQRSGLRGGDGTLARRGVSTANCVSSCDILPSVFFS